MKGNSIGKNVLHLFIGTTLSRVLNAAALVVLAQYLNSHQYGLFSVAYAFTMVAGYFTDVGLSNTVLREGARQDADAGAILSSYIKVRIALLALTFLGAAVLIHLLYGQGELAWTMYSLLVPMVLGLAMQSVGITYFQLAEKMQYLSAIRIWSALLLVIIIGLGMLGKVHPYTMAFLFGLSYFLAGLYAIYMVQKHLPLTFQQPFQRGLLAGIGPFILSGLLMMLMPQMGALILEKTIPLELIGLFAVAQRIPTALYQVPGIIGGAFYPVLFKLYHSGQVEAHMKLNLLQMKLIGLLSMLLTIPLFHWSEWIIAVLFGREWLAAAQPLQWLAITLTLQGIGISLADGLTTQGMQGRRTAVQVITVLAGAALYGLLSVKYGIQGAVYAALAVESMTVLGCWLCLPNRGMAARKALLPYLSLFAFILYSTHALLSDFPVWAAVCSFLLLSLVFIDAEIRGAVAAQIRKQIETRSGRKKDVHSA